MTNKSKRIYYRPGPMSINGVVVRGVQIVSINTYFELTQCFCSCPFPLESMGTFDKVQVHHDDCPNADPKRFIRTVSEEEIREYKSIWCNNK